MKTFVLGLLLCGSCIFAQIPKTCPNGWTSFNTAQNKLTCTWFSNEKATWIDAMSWCKLLGGQLVEIGSYGFNQHVQQNIQVRNTGKYWIGLSDIENEFQYKWMTSNEPNTLLTNMQGSTAKNCVATDEKGQWLAESCKAEFWFVCQKIPA